MTAVAAILLSDQHLLNGYLQGDWLQPAHLQQRLFHALREQQPFQPDYAVEAGMQDAGLSAPGEPASAISYAGLLLQALQSLATPLHLRGRRLHVQQDTFEAWQQSLTSVMPLPVISFFAAQQAGEHQAFNYFKDWFAQQSCLPRPYLPELTGLFEQGLSEHHLHIMGTTESDYAWLDALRRPKAMLNSLAKATNTTDAQQQLAQINPQIRFGDLYPLLRLAADLRNTLLDFVQGPALTVAELHTKLRSWPASFSSRHPAVAHTGVDCLLFNEAMLLHAFYRQLEHTRCEVAARCLHVYLLIQSLFHRLLNQQLSDKGFQQFEKITKNELRETVEERFTQRFEQLQGMYKTPLSLLEARFAPKPEAGKLRRLLTAITSGYAHSTLNGNTRLSLTAHFIKSPDRHAGLHPCRHYPLRQRLQKQKQVLQHYLTKQPELRGSIVGIDAAGNEMHTGADVFAPLYRQLRAEGFQYFTYHAGEDFRHLLSGMRQVFEAVHYLGLQPGDRIGHATAVGIAPELWLQRAAPRQWLTRGEWLDNLLFTHHILLQIGSTDATRYAYELEGSITELAEQLFGHGHFSLQSLTAAWLERWRDPLDDTSGQELAPSVDALCKAWHHAEVYARAQQIQFVTSDFLPAALYRQMQEKLLETLCRKQIALEILPTSNLRISYYQSYNEHHVHRWLHADASNRPAVVMGSDDPGIFATNLANEYAHIYISAKALGSADKARGMVQEIMENGRDYGFYPRIYESTGKRFD